MERAVQSVSPLERDVASEFARRTRERFGARIRELRIFGSRARGDAREGSDLDIWVLLDEAGSRERGEISDIACDLLIEKSLPFALTPRVMSVEQYEKLRSLERLLPMEIDRDGIPL